MICRRGQPGRSGNGMNSLHPAHARGLACMQGPESAPQIREVLKRSCIVHQVEDGVEPICTAPTRANEPLSGRWGRAGLYGPYPINETLSDPVFAFDFI